MIIKTQVGVNEVLPVVVGVLQDSVVRFTKSAGAIPIIKL